MNQNKPYNQGNSNHQKGFKKGGGFEKSSGKNSKKQLKNIYESQKFFLREKAKNLEEIFFEEFENIITVYIDWRKGRGKRPEWVFNIFMDIAFASVFEDLLYENIDFVSENGDFICEIVSNAVTELERRRINHYREVIEIYSKQYEEVNEKRVEKIFDLELPNLTWDDALRLAIISHGSPKFTVINTLRTIYRICQKCDQDEIYKLLKKMYGKHNMSKVSVYILLEKKMDQGKSNWINKDLYNMLTTLALTTLEDKSKDELNEMLELYVDERRRSEFESPSRRRVLLSELDKDEYPKIVKRIKKLSKHNRMNKLFLDQEIKPFSLDRAFSQDRPQQYGNRNQNNRRHR